jgi:catechol 2,3-dioxygenase-like lactoylglutathione lyase family enzyme
MSLQYDIRPIDPQVRIGHVHLKVADLERSLRFYCGVLGFQLTQRYGSQAASLRRVCDKRDLILKADLRPPPCPDAVVADDDGSHLPSRSPLPNTYQAPSPAAIDEFLRRNEPMIEASTCGARSEPAGDVKTRTS